MKRLIVPRSRRKHESETYGSLVDLCRDCHRKIHATWDNKTVARQYGTLELLRAATELQSYLKWIRKKPASAYFGSRDRKH